MRLLKIKVNEYHCIRDFECSFGGEVTALIGYNGAGKTTLIELIAAITGVPSAFDLVRGRQADVILHVEENGEEHIFTHVGIFDDKAEAKVRRFKSNFDGRSSFSIVEPDYKFSKDAFSLECGNYDTREIKRMLSGIDLIPEVGLNADGSVDFLSGDGAVQVANLVTSLVNVQKTKENILLWDHPEKSLHIVVQRAFRGFLGDNQVILTSHSPEMIESTDEIVDMSAKTDGTT